MKQILVVEDNRDISALIKMNLQYAGYSVLQAYDGSEAECLLKECPDLIILDLTLPEIDGLDLLPSMVERDIPVLIVSARVKALLRRRADSVFYSINKLKIKMTG